MTPHDHQAFVPGCFRCELGRDEARDTGVCNGPCGVCGADDNHGIGDACWYAPNPVWNRVYGTPDNVCGDGVLRCPACFTRDAQAAGISVIWRAEGFDPGGDDETQALTPGFRKGEDDA